MMHLLFLATTATKFLASFVLLLTERHKSQLFPAAKHFNITVLPDASKVQKHFLHKCM